MINYSSQNHQPVIVVVDDERTLRLVLHKAMEKQGYRVIEACDTRHCLDICQQQLPDLVLLDAMMPGVDGFACCAQLHSLFGANCPPVLMITALDDQESVDRAFEVQATDYITKPIDWNLLSQRVSRLLTSRWAKTQLQQQIQRECQLTVKMEVANRELQRLDSIDHLTRIANRDYFDEYLQREWNRLQKYQLPVSLILCNINFFKPNRNIDDEPAVAKYLAQVAQTISKCKRRAADLVARYSHAEFALLLSNTQSEDALNVAQAIFSTVQAPEIVAAHPGISEFILLNLGVASIIPTSEKPATQLVKHAKVALEQAKLSERDRIVINS